MSGTLRRCVACLLIAFEGMASACYVYTPTPANPPAGARVVLELNDRGRVGLGNNIGPTGREVEGVLSSTSDSAYALRVVRVGYLNGQSNQWNGEQLQVTKDFVQSAKERRFSQSRTALAVGSLALAVGTFIVTRNLLGFGSTVGGGKNPPPPNQ